MYMSSEVVDRHTRIIRFKRQRKIALRIQQRNITSRRVIEVEVGDIPGLVELRVTLLIEDDEVVAVEVDGMGGWNLFFRVVDVLACDDQVYVAFVVVVCGESVSFKRLWEGGGGAAYSL